jgi:asparagine synthase (glutamine-hydrolysing)
MCGIAGFHNFGMKKNKLQNVIKTMTSTLLHRGPDSNNVWTNENFGIALGHTRLSIQDPSENGNQPMISNSGRYMIVYNGEIYNHQSLRKKINQKNSDYKWIGTSDTETILAFIDEFGLLSSIKYFEGMFAFAIYDLLENKIYLVRDRMGEKPLYFSFNKNLLIFASELRAIKASNLVDLNLSSSSIYDVVINGYIKNSKSIYNNINKVQPGYILEFDLNNLNKTFLQHKFWSIYDSVRLGVENKFLGSFGSAVDKTHKILINTVNKQMISDVPYGAFLSGGIDSTMIVALMQSSSTTKIKTFSVGFKESGYDEAIQAKKISNYLGTDHTEFYLSSSDALQIIPKLSSIFDEPFADISQIPSYLVSSMTSTHVKVALSGDGGDEIFGGYNRYIGTAKWMSIIKTLPYPIRILLSKILSIKPKNYRFANTFVDEIFFDKLSKISNILNFKSHENLYDTLTNNSNVEFSVFNEDFIFPNNKSLNLSFNIDINDVEKIMLLDSTNYLQYYVLFKLDRSSMAVGLETRAPFLDHLLIQHAWTLPFEYKINKGKGKVLLREILKKIIPEELINSSKKGFSVPIGVWLKGPLRDWAENLLEERKLNDSNFFDSKTIRKIWFEHLNGHKNWQQQLWNILMFQAWFEKNKL